MIRSRYILGLFLSVALAVPVFGADVATIRSNVLNGNYETAFAEAEALQTAEGQVLASESLLSEIVLGRAKKNKKQAKRAREFAARALQLDPTNQDARLQYAVADGIVSRETGDIASLMNKIPQKTRAVIEAYREDYPNDPRGDALLGAWHLTITRRAGPGNARKMFGANILEGQAFSRAAIARDPADVIMSVNYAFSLLALDEKDFPDSEEARRVLIEICKAEPKDYLEEVLLVYAEEALARIDDRDRVEEYVEMFLEGKKPE